jgi:hypothetical protein
MRYVTCLDCLDIILLILLFHQPSWLHHQLIVILVTSMPILCKRSFRARAALHLSSIILKRGCWNRFRLSPAWSPWDCSVFRTQWWYGISEFTQCRRVVIFLKSVKEGRYLSLLPASYQSDCLFRHFNSFSIQREDTDPDCITYILYCACSNVLLNNHCYLLFFRNCQDSKLETPLYILPRSVFCCSSANFTSPFFIWTATRILYQTIE